MRLKIVGSAAGGGFPQWNCNYRLSRAARAGVAGVVNRGRSRASPLRPTGAIGSSSTPPPTFASRSPRRLNCSREPMRRCVRRPIRAVVLTNADVDHVAGLLSLRERQPFAIYATAQVLRVLDANSIFNVLDPAIVPRRDAFRRRRTGDLRRGGPRHRRDGSRASPCPARSRSTWRIPPGPTWISAPTAATRSACASPPARAAARSTFPAARGSTRHLRARLDGAACLLFDGTVYTDDEMIVAGVGQKTGARMGHIAMSGEGRLDRRPGRS